MVAGCQLPQRLRRFGQDFIAHWWLKVELVDENFGGAAIAGAGAGQRPAEIDPELIDLAAVGEPGSFLDMAQPVHENARRRKHLPHVSYAEVSVRVWRRSGVGEVGGEALVDALSPRRRCHIGPVDRRSTFTCVGSAGTQPGIASPYRPEPPRIGWLFGGFDASGLPGCSARTDRSAG